MNEIIETLNLLLGDTEKALSDLQEKLGPFLVNEKGLTIVKNITEANSTDQRSMICNKLLAIHERINSINANIGNLKIRLDC